jgi:voltage-gated potassium channel
MAAGARLMPVVLRLLMRRVMSQPPAPLRVVVLLAAVLLYGASGFMYFELPEKPELGWADGFWYSIVTVTTVGYGDLYPTTPGGRFVVAVPMMFFGIGLLGYVLSLAASALVEAKNKELHGMSAFKLDRHLVLFNYPGLSKIERVLDELARDPSFGKREIVLIDDTLDMLPAELDRRGIHFVRGNPTHDETLTRASLDACAYAIVLSKATDLRPDDLNVAITLAIEARSKKVHTVVECVDYSAQELLRKAGCDGIVCTSRFDAHFLSHELLNPGIQEVVEELTSNARGQQIYVTPYSGDQKRSFAELAALCFERGHVAIGIRSGSATQLNVPAETSIVPGDQVITIGATRLGTLG